MARYCSLCDARFDGDPECCPFDGARTFRLDTRDPNLGRTLGQRYTLVEILGSGGMGTVYRARQRSMERDVAVKLLKPERMNDPEAVRRFFQEARAASRLTSPHVITLHDFGQASDGQFYLVMELLVGRSLGDHRLQRGGRIPASEAVAILDQVLQAIEVAHRQGVIHRDLKPDNIFLLESPPGFVKVLDFGLARILDLESRLSDPNLLFGTPAYMSPEQAKGKPVDHRSDLYALGVILFELLTGQLPFQAGSSLAMLLKKFHRAAPRVQDLLPGGEVPPSLSDLVSRLLANDPNRRPQTAAEVRRQLQTSISAGGGSMDEAALVRRVPVSTPSAGEASREMTARWRGSVSRSLPLLITGARKEALQKVLIEAHRITGEIWEQYRSGMCRVRGAGARALIGGLMEMAQREHERLRQLLAALEEGSLQALRAPEDQDSLDPAGAFDLEARRSPEEILADRDLPAILEEASRAEWGLREQLERWTLAAVGGPELEVLSPRLVRCRERGAVLSEAGLRLVGLVRGAGVHSLYQRLAGLLPVQHVRSGETVFRQGETGQGMVVVIRGQLRVMREAEEHPGVSIPLSQLGPGDLVGEMACLDPAPRSATVVAYNDAEVCVMDRQMLAELRREDPIAWMGVLETVGGQVVHRILQSIGTLESWRGIPAGDLLRLSRAPRLGARRLAIETREMFQFLGVRRTLESGQWLWREGDGTWGAGLIQQGALVVLLQREGMSRQVGRLETGSLVGGPALLGGGGRLTSIQAAGTCEVLALEMATFQMLLENGHPPAMEFLFSLVEMAIRRLRVANAWVEWVQRTSWAHASEEAEPSSVGNPLDILKAALAEWELDLPLPPSR